ncbi:hypothetical protein [Streptomyces sp. NBC_00582]|uniref:hypothetical protein n=1 Tax=Streptomyces sp. NBC_00582 TaxID=2975783 RepID=UPI001063D7B1|nr:hypothetical protein [Streptomyces sp. NBC_00582]WUB61415.1 hypothetical protein OG852_13970 [Streptomyces sp. NBC_00582]
MREGQNCTARSGEQAPTDLFCSGNSFLPFSGASAGARRLLLSVLALLLPTSVSASAHLHSALPLLVPALGCAALFTLAPLRLYPTTRRVAAVLLVLACGVGGAAHWGGATVRRVVLTSALGAAALLWAWCAGRIAWYGGWSGLAPRASARRTRAPAPSEPSPDDRHEPWMLPGALTFGSATAVLPVLMIRAALRYAPDGLLWDPPQAVRLWLDRAPWLGVLGALLTAALAGFVHGFRTFDPVVTPLLGRPRPLPVFAVSRPRWRLRPASGTGPLDHLAQLIEAMLHQVAGLVVTLGAIVLNILIMSAELTLRAVVLVVNLVWRVLVHVTRLLVSALGRALGVLAEAAVLGCGAVLRSTRVVVVPLLLLGVQSLCAWSFAASGSAYEESGALTELAVALGAPAAGYAAAVGTWSLWCGERLRPCLGSAFRTGQTVAVWTAVLVPVTSWIVCAPHWITGGPVTPGWVFYGSTALLLGALAVWAIRGRPGAGKRSTG